MPAAVRAVRVRLLINSYARIALPGRMTFYDVLRTSLPYLRYPNGHGIPVMCQHANRVLVPADSDGHKKNSHNSI